MPSVQSGGVANGIGQPVRRKEDFRLLTGKGRYGDDDRDWLADKTHSVCRQGVMAGGNWRAAD